MGNGRLSKGPHIHLISWRAPVPLAVRLIGEAQTLAGRQQIMHPYPPSPPRSRAILRCGAVLPSHEHSARLNPSCAARSATQMLRRYTTALLETSGGEGPEAHPWKRGAPSTNGRLVLSLCHACEQALARRGQFNAGTAVAACVITPVPNAVYSQHYVLSGGAEGRCLLQHRSASPPLRGMLQRLAQRDPQPRRQGLMLCKADRTFHGGPPSPAHR